MSESRLHFRPRSLPVIMQSEAAECGLACLAMIASYFGSRTDLNTLRQRHHVSLHGVTLRDLIQVAGQMKMASRPLRFDLSELKQLARPCLVHWDLDHFVVLKRVRSREIVVHDPALGERRYSLGEASRHLTGIALELQPTESFQKGDHRRKLPLSAFWSHSSGFGRTLAEVFALSLALEAVLLAAPFYMQIAVDEVIAQGDLDLMLVLALGFSMLAAIRIVLTALRSRLILVVQGALHYQIGARLFRHLLRLPMNFFEKRHVGDVLSRFGSIDPVRSILAEGFVAAVVDGMLAVLTLAMLFVYSTPLSLVVTAAVLICICIRTALFGRFRRMNEMAIQVKAVESSIFIESVRAIQSIKLHGREPEREGQWLNRFADAVNADLRLGRAKIGFAAVNELISGAEYIVTVYLAVRLAIANQITVGMIFAFMSYRQLFVEKTLQLVDKGLDLTVVRLHLGRVADIALSPTERGHDTPISYRREIRGELVLQNVSFRYADTDPFVLENVSLTIPAGQFMTIMGPSGGGKTTLVKIMLGLLEPTSGEVLIDGIPLRTFGPRAYREQVAAVMQDDQLLSGSIAENVCFLDPRPDEGRMVDCAVLAGIHHEIMTMPMGYGSLIGDMGSSLSGGQKQRILLARALYRGPKILFLDEGTAHLDVENERLISESLRQLAITRISVAHRPEITSGADVLVRVERAAIPSPLRPSPAKAPALGRKPAFRTLRQARKRRR